MPGLTTVDSSTASKEDVGRDLHEDGAGPTSVGVAESHAQDLGDALGVVDRGGELGDRPHQADVVQLLQRAHVGLLQRPLTADDQHGHLGTPGVGHRGHRIGGARAGRDHGTAGKAGQSGPGVGGVSGGLLVAHVDDADVGIDAAIVNVDDVSAAEGKDRLDPLGLEGPGYQLAARHRAGGGRCLPLNRQAHDLFPSCFHPRPTI